ncbi:Transcription initiation factor TFIID subunit 7, partial [Ananas comosus]
MEEQFILRVPPSVAERIERLLNENASSSEDGSLDLSFSDVERSELNLVSLKQVIMVREDGDPAPEGVEYKHGLTPPMRDARRRRFRREPDLNPELVQRVERDLINIMSGGTVENILLFGHFLDTLHCFVKHVLPNLYWDAPAVIPSYYDKRIVGCPGGEG